MDEEPKVKPQYSMEGTGLHSYKNVKLEKSYEIMALRPMVEAILYAHLKLPILDLASGLGDSADYFESRGIKTVRLDISTIAGKFQSKKGFVLGDMNTKDLPFADNSFSGVHIKDSMVHIKNKRNFFNEMSRILIPDGRLVLTTVSKLLQETTKDGIKYYPVNINKLVNEGNRAGLALDEQCLWCPLYQSTD